MARAIIRLVRTLKEVVHGESGRVPTVGLTPAFAVAVFKPTPAAIAAVAATAVASTVVVETSSLSTRLLIALNDYILFVILGGMASTRAEWAARRGL